MFVRPRKGAWWAILAAGVCLFISGCGGSTSTVRGKVTQSGKTVVWGTVTLVDQTGMNFQADIDLNGNYEINAVAVGPVKIGVTSPDPGPAQGHGGGGGGAVPDAKNKPGAAGRGGSEDPRDKFLAEKGIAKSVDNRPRPPAGAWFAIDRKFADPATSGLTGEVKSGTTEINIDIK